jgi:hypothetical protein
MEWYLFPGEFEAAFGGSPAPWLRRIDDTGPVGTGTTRRAALANIDLELIELIYGFIADASRCSQCGAPLGRGLRIVPSRGLHARAHWRVSVSTRCRGWRRHRHVAAVARRHDLELGTLRR